MKDRIHKIRSDHKMNQEDFGKKISITKASVSRLESGINNPSEQTIKLICSEFNVNENWLLTGEGDPYITLKADKTIALSAALLSQKDPLFESIVEVYSKLNDIQKNVIINVMEDLVKKYHTKKE